MSMAKYDECTVRSNLRGRTPPRRNKAHSARTKTRKSTCRVPYFYFGNACTIYYLLSRILRTLGNTALRQDRLPSSETRVVGLTEANRNLRTCSLSQTPDVLLVPTNKRIVFFGPPVHIYGERTVWSSRHPQCILSRAKQGNHISTSERNLATNKQNSLPPALFIGRQKSNTIINIPRARKSIALSCHRLSCHMNLSLFYASFPRSFYLFIHQASRRRPHPLTLAPVSGTIDLPLHAISMHYSRLLGDKIPRFCCHGHAAELLVSGDRVGCTVALQ